MNVRVWKDDAGHCLRFEGSIDMADLTRVDLDALDLAVLNTPHENAADMLQDLELLFRRAIEAARG